MKLHIDDIARSLNLPVNTLRRWIRQGRVPIQKAGDTCVFKKEKLEDWAKRNSLSFKSNEPGAKSDDQTLERTLSCSVKYGEVLFDIEASSKDELFIEVVENLNIDTDLKKELLLRLEERESMSSTGVGKGVAIPHPRDPIEYIGDFPKIITVFTKDTIEFDSIDNENVFVLFFILCRNVKEHLKVLSNLSFCLRHESFITFLRTKPCQDDLIKEISIFEDKLEKH